MQLRMLFEASWWPGGPDEDDGPMLAKMLYDPYYEIKRGHIDRQAEEDDLDSLVPPDPNAPTGAEDYFGDFTDEELENPPEDIKPDYGAFNEPEHPLLGLGHVTDIPRADKAYARKKDVHKRHLSHPDIN